MPKILPGHTRTEGGKLPGKRTFLVPTINGEVLQKPSRILALSFLCKETSQVMSNLTSPDAQVCGDMRVMSDVGGIWRLDWI